MSIALSSSWGSPRGWKLISLTLLGLTLLLIVPLYQLSDHDASGLYGKVNKYLGHDGAAYEVDPNPPESLVASLTETDAGDVIPTSDAPADDAEGSNDPKAGEDGGDKPESEGDKELAPDNSEAGAGGESNGDVNNSEGEGSKQEGDDKPKDSDKDEIKPEDEGNSNDQNNDNDDQTKDNGSVDENKDQNSGSEGDKSENKPEEGKESNDAPTGTPSALGGVCADFPDTEGIILVMKTGASEAFEKLPMHLLTSIQCLPDVLLFSDLEQQIGKYHIYDVLEDVKDDVKKGRKEFDLYKAQSECPIPQAYCTEKMKGGWDLDKYKFLHMVERAWAMRPNKEWYVFAEADSYVFWSNLIYWLRNKADPAVAPYVGSVAMLKGTPFAHGGSGYVIHGETLKKMVELPNLADRYDEMATHECCGDYLMSLAVNETGYKVKQAHPMFNGEKPVTLPFGHGHWCEPLLTMHHMNSEEVSMVWQYEQSREKQGILQIREMYYEFFAPHLVERREEWDNLSDDVCYIGPEPEAQSKATDHQKGRQKRENDKNAAERRAHFSEEHCAKVCQYEGLGISDEDYNEVPTEEERGELLRKRYEERKDDTGFHQNRRCFQWRYHNNACCIAKSFKNGKPRPEEKPEEKWTSGWFIQGINDWIAAKGDCEPKWKEIH